MKKSGCLFTLVLVIVLGYYFQDQIKDYFSEPPETVLQPSIEDNIQFIRDKYEIINNVAGYKTVSFREECDELSLVEFQRKYNEEGDLDFVQLVECGDHGCTTKEYYYWEKELIFIFHVYDYLPGVSQIIEERRSYLKAGETIRCLEKSVISE